MLVIPSDVSAETLYASKAKQATVIRLEMFSMAFLHHSAFFLSIPLPRFQLKNRLLWGWKQFTSFQIVSEFIKATGL